MQSEESSSSEGDDMTGDDEGFYYSGQVIGIIKETRTTGFFKKTFGRVPKDYRENFLPGSLENAGSFEYPVQYKALDISQYPEGPRTLTPSPELGKSMVKKAKELEVEGAGIVSTDCGFYVYFQDAMAEAVSIPVCTSALLMVPLVSKLIGRDRRVGIMTWNSRALSKEHLRRAGIDESVKIAIVGYQKWAKQRVPMFQADGNLPPEKRLAMLEEDLVSASKELIQKYPDVGAIVLECTAFPPAAYAVQRATGLPVFDIVMLLNWIGDAVVRKRCPQTSTV
jgi:hypothetical protein